MGRNYDYYDYEQIRQEKYFISYCAIICDFEVHGESLNKQELFELSEFEVISFLENVWTANSYFDNLIHYSVW
jgi:alpha-N-acetylglucosamine transferase